MSSLRQVVIRADANSRPGRLFARDGHPTSPYEDAQMIVGRFPSIANVMKVLVKHRMSQEDLIRMAIGDEPAIRRGRVRPMNSMEAGMVLETAFANGFTLDPRWGFRWNKFSSSSPFLWSYKVMNRACKNDGLDLPIVAHRVARYLGLGYERKLFGRFEARSPMTPQLARELSRSFLTTAELGKYPGLERRTQMERRKRGTLIGFQVPGSTKTFHPDWQFDARMKPLPIVPRIAELIRRMDVAIEDLQAEMHREVIYKGRSTSLRELAQDPDATEWILSELHARLIPSERGGRNFDRARKSDQ